MSWSDCIIEHVKGGTYSLKVITGETSELVAYPIGADGQNITLSGPLKITQMEAMITGGATVADSGAKFEVHRVRSLDDVETAVVIGRILWGGLSHKLENISNTSVSIKKGDSIKVSVTGIPSGDPKFVGEITFTRRF